MSNPTEYVQPIMLLVDKTNPASHRDAIRAVALASVRLYARDRVDGAATDIWSEWLSGPFAKSVRRADTSAFDKVLALSDPNDLLEVSVGRAKAVAFRPVRATEMPRPLKRLQVSGTQLEEAEESWLQSSGPTIILNDSLGMSTGKAAAQAAHALFSWYLDQTPDTGVTCNIRFEREADFHSLIAESGSRHVIEDAGRTEVASGSTTAFALV